MPSRFTLGLGIFGSSTSVASQGDTTVTVFTGSHGNTTVGVTAGELDPVKTVLSQESARAFHSTLFEDFQLQATSYYNYYTEDEQVAFSTDASASLHTLPRYVWLSWKPTPIIRVLTPTTKEIRPLDQRKTQVNPVLDVASAKNSVANGYVSPGTISALLVPPVKPTQPTRFDEDLFLSSPTAAGKMAAVAFDADKAYSIEPILDSDQRTRVNFVDPSIAGAMDPNRISVASDQTHLVTLGAISKIVGGLEVLSEFNQDVPTRNPPPSFPAPAESPGLMYTGYVIERYTLGQDGSMELSRTINISDTKQTKFADREVVFGARYAYRIRSIVQWTRASTEGFFGNSTLDRNPQFDTSMFSPTRQASYYSGDWSDWARTEIRDDRLPDPPDEITVRPVSHRKQIHVTWKMPNDPQRDISAVRLLRSKVIDGRYADWEQIGEYVPGNGIYIDSDVTPHEETRAEYMYAMYSVSFHGEMSVLSEKVKARLTDRSRYLGEEPVVQVGPKGDDPMAHASGPRDPVDTELVVSKRATVYVRGGRSSLPLFNRHYVVEVQSVATGQRVEIPLSVSTTDVEVGPSGAARRA